MTAAYQPPAMVHGIICRDIVAVIVVVVAVVVVFAVVVVVVVVVLTCILRI